MIRLELRHKCSRTGTYCTLSVIEIIGVQVFMRELASTLSLSFRNIIINAQDFPYHSTRQNITTVGKVGTPNTNTNKYQSTKAPNTAAYYYHSLCILITP
jgi:uncharacterized protein (UPF0333 family)